MKEQHNLLPDPSTVAHRRLCLHRRVPPWIVVNQQHGAAVIATAAAITVGLQLAVPLPAAAQTLGLEVKMAPSNFDRMGHKSATARCNDPGKAPTKVVIGGGGLLLGDEPNFKFTSLIPDSGSFFANASTGTDPVFRDQLGRLSATLQ